MAAALDAVDLVAICLLVVALAMTVLAIRFAEAVGGAIDVDIPFVGHPFHFVTATINNALVPRMQAVADAERTAIHHLWSGLVWSFRLVIAGARDLADGVDDALVHAWTVLHDTFVDAYAYTHRQVVRLDGRVDSTLRELYSDVLALEAFARARADAAFHAAVGYADSAVAQLHRTVAHEIAAARQAAENYADVQVGHVAHTLAGVEHELTNVEGEVAGVIEAIPGDVLAELDALARAAGAKSIAELLKAVPVTAAALLALEAATGLDGAGCRSKVKGICGVDPAAWANLLAGLAVLDFTLSLRAIADPARALVHDLDQVIAQHD